MFNNNNKNQKVDEIDTVIGPDTKLEGKIEAIGIVRVDGRFHGEIITQGDIIIGENGEVEGKLNAKTVIVAGFLKANPLNVGKLVIRTTGKVIGDVEVSHIVIEENAVFEGNCSMNYNKDNNTKRDKEKEKEVVNV